MCCEERAKTYEKVVRLFILVLRKYKEYKIIIKNRVIDYVYNIIIDNRLYNIV